MIRAWAVRASVAATLLLAVPALSAAPVADMLGRRVEVPARPARVVSLAPNLTEILFALGLGDRVVGVSQNCDFPAEARTKPRVGGIANPSLEAIVGLRPDLVLATLEGNLEADVRRLEGLGLPVYVLRPIDVATVLESIERVGRLLGKDLESTRLTGEMRRRADDIARAVAGAPRPRVLYVLWGDPLIVPGRDTLITDLIRRAGGDSVTGDEPLPYPRLSAEEAVARRPDRIILPHHGEASVDERLRAWRHLALLPAVRQGRVHSVDGDLAHRPGPRVVDALLALARLLHPERVR